ncbi:MULTISPECIES: hypothetical protein [Pseudomonas]|jgi:predicted DNA-binding protein|uniref:Uncharacterized protein n=1 Tax=Pseudomonas rhodesiae TaxID=76760 RepID=A0AAE8H7X8_9PSED|nr:MULTISPECIES: hypothetical protein [Pseudomonas]MBU0791995.1 hypothetical protein [Gammaproteobacteria bacterium]OKP70476.1 hypothetical protein BTR19_14935 [Pseudomonas fluorescens]EPJ81393.1 hypothetical protein CFT9_19715 [Pseudomonas sp. CFT9]MDF3190726.1 hypothetical protein [Pseudomonas paracarnis]NTT51634.1 hypothetical protein [Pseudomonas aeruginosa]
MAETENAPSWLNELDRKEAEWAASYLSKRWPEGLKAKPSPTPPMLYHSLAESIHELEKYAAGVKLIERMRNSIRQRRYRLAEGGRKTCSFTLPLNTKDKLKILAKNADTTETAIIESLIAGALQSSQDQKEGKRREALEKTITRNSSKLAQELNKIRLEVTTKHLDASLRRLAGWQVYLNEQTPELSAEQESEANRIAEKRMREIQEAIRAVLAKHEMMSPRNI